MPSQEYDCSKDGLYGSADQEAGKHISKLLQYLPATLWDKVHNFAIGNWCKAVTDLFGTSRSLLEKPSFSVAETQLLKSQNSAKTLNAHGLNTLQQPLRIDARIFSCRIGLPTEYNLDGAGKGDCLPFHMLAASATYSWLAVDLHVISG